MDAMDVEPEKQQHRLAKHRCLVNIPRAVVAAAGETGKTVQTMAAETAAPMAQMQPAMLQTITAAPEELKAAALAAKEIAAMARQQPFMVPAVEVAVLDIRQTEVYSLRAVALVTRA